MPNARAWWRRFVVVIVVAAVVSPAVRDRDSFPLSTYPVYASVRPRQVAFETAIGRRSDGTERSLPMDVIAATDDPLIAQQRVRGAIDSGRAGELCELIAGRSPADVHTVLVVREVHDVVDATSGSPSMLSRTVHAECEGQR